MCVCVYACTVYERECLSLSFPDDLVHCGRGVIKDQGQRPFPFPWEDEWPCLKVAAFGLRAIRVCCEPATLSSLQRQVLERKRNTGTKSCSAEAVHTAVMGNKLNVILFFWHPLFFFFFSLLPTLFQFSPWTCTDGKMMLTAARREERPTEAAYSKYQYLILVIIQHVAEFWQVDSAALSRWNSATTLELEVIYRSNGIFLPPVTITSRVISLASRTYVQQLALHLRSQFFLSSDGPSRLRQRGEWWQPCW